MLGCSLVIYKIISDEYPTLYIIIYLFYTHNIEICFIIPIFIVFKTAFKLYF